MTLGRLSAVIALAAVAPTTAWAQAPAVARAASTPVPAVAEWVGTWTGAFTYGTMTLTIGREPSKWTVTCLFEGEGLPSEEVRMWSVEGRAFSWVQTVGPYDLFVRGTLEEGVLKGSFEVYKEGVYGGTEVFVLKKAP